MSDEQVAAAAATSEPAQQAPAAVEPATPAESIRDVDALPENAEAKATTDAKADEQGKPEGEEAERKKLSRSQRKDRKIARLTTMVTEQATELESFRKTATANQDAEPKEADFNGDYFAWQRAVAKWDTKQLLKEVAPQIAPEKKQPDARDLNREEAQQEFQELAEQVKASIPDFVETIEAFNAKHKLAPHVIEELLEVGEKGPLLAYQLAKNPSVAAELNAMSPRDAAREIGRLEAKATLPERKTITKAPAPLTKISGGAAPTVDVHALAKSDNADDYVAARRAQRKARA